MTVFMSIPAFFLQQGGGLLIGLLPYVAVIAIFDFLVIVPQRKRQKQTEEMLNNLKNGDRVVTTGGLLGTVSGINAKENTIQLQIAPSVKVEIVRSAVTALQADKGEQKG